MADAARKDANKLGAFSQTAAEQGQMDLSGFRIGKQRLVSKKKTKSNLKSLILEERAYIKASKVIGTESQPHGNLTTNGLSLDAPEFVPVGWNLASIKELAESESALHGVADGVPSTPSETGEVNFQPSWCTSSVAASASRHQDESVPPVAVADGQVEEQNMCNQTDTWDLPVTAAIERLRAIHEENQQQTPKNNPKKGLQTSVIEVRQYVHQVLSDALDDKVKIVLGELVRFQERAKERDPLKYQKQKRMCVGLREANRSVARGRAKGVICAPNLEECSATGGLDDTVEDLIESCREHDVPVIFALSRNRLGKALGKHIRISIVCILSAEGVHQEFKQVLKLAEDLRKQWVFRQMANLSVEDAEAARERAEQRDARDAERRLAREAKIEQRRVEQEKTRAEARAAKEAEKARKRAAHEAEMERRAQLKAAREKEKAARESAEQEAAEEARRQQEAERRLADVVTAANLKKDAQERARVAQQRQAAQPNANAKREAATRPDTKAADAGSESDSESASSGSSVPLGFSATLF